MIEELIGAGLLMVGTACFAVHQATKSYYVMAIAGRDWVASQLEDENQKLKQQVQKLSARTSPVLELVLDSRPGSEFERPSVPPPSLVSFRAPNGSIIPPPPAFLFDLPKQSPSLAEISHELSPISKRLASMTEARASVIPPPPPMGNLAQEFGLGRKPSENFWNEVLEKIDQDWTTGEEEVPPTLRSERSEKIAASLRPGALEKSN